MRTNVRAHAHTTHPHAHTHTHASLSLVIASTEMLLQPLCYMSYRKQKVSNIEFLQSYKSMMIGRGFADRLIKYRMSFSGFLNLRNT